MKILILTECANQPGFGGGGAESLLRDQTEALKRRGYQIAWLHSGDIEQAMLQFKPDIVQVNTIHNFIGFEPVLWLQQNDIPHVWAMMDYYIFCGSRMLLKNWDESCSAVEGICDGNCQGSKANWLDIANASPIIAFNKYTADIYRRNGLHCDAVIELGIDTEAFKPGERDKEVSIYTSSAWAPYPAKGMKYLQEAIRGTDWNVNLLTGLPRERIAEALKRAHIYIFPSTYQETWGLCLNEAMASGCACIASDVAGARAQIENGVTGLLVDPRNVEQLKAAIKRLMDNEALRVELGTNARAKVEKENSLEAMGERWDQLYQRILTKELAIF